MKIEILGCSGSVMKGFNTTSILVNEDILIDAGSAASVLPDDGICAIRHILITHSHIDHIKELPFILDTLLLQQSHGVTVWGSKDTINALNKNIFNGIIWPKIRELNNHKEFVKFEEVPDKEFSAGNIRIRPIHVEHIRGSLSYLISEGDNCVLISGDTGYNQALFDLACSLGARLKAFFIEVSFPDSMNELAQLTRHITPMLLRKGIAEHVSPSTRVIAYHIKPKHIDEVVAELPPNVAYITGGEVFEF
jgi:ribonuclease BN (tRNA processing enzyme)